MLLSGRNRRHLYVALLPHNMLNVCVPMVPVDPKIAIFIIGLSQNYNTIKLAARK